MKAQITKKTTQSRIIAEGERKQIHYILIVMIFILCINHIMAQTSDNNVVGTTKGILKVTQMGNANYTIPLVLPQGSNSFIPQLAIVLYLN